MNDFWDRQPNLDAVLTQLRGMHLKDAKEGNGTIPSEIIETIVALEVFNGDTLKPWLAELNEKRNTIGSKLSNLHIFYSIIMVVFAVIYWIKDTYVPRLGFLFALGLYIGSKITIDMLRHSGRTQQ